MCVLPFEFTHLFGYVPANVLYSPSIQPQFSFHIDTPSFQNTIALFPRFPMNFRPVSSICLGCTLTHTLTFSPSLHLFTINGMEWDRVLRCSGKFCPPPPLLLYLSSPILFILWSFRTRISPFASLFQKVNNALSLWAIFPSSQFAPAHISKLLRRPFMFHASFWRLLSIPQIYMSTYTRGARWQMGKKNKTTRANDASLMIEETWKYKCMNP